MTNEEYYKNIYRIKNAIQKLDDEYWENAELHDPAREEEYYDQRDKMCAELEKAYKA